jgi:hypothetical protein
MKPKLLAIALASYSALAPTGCAHEGEISFTIYDTRSADNGGGDNQIIHDACEIWGLDCFSVATHTGWGSVTVILTDSGAEDPDSNDLINGVALHRPCAPVIWSVGSKYTLAHEIGHVLGLGHVKDKTNVMYPSSGRVVTEMQKREVRRQATELSVCVGGV